MPSYVRAKQGVLSEDFTDSSLEEDIKRLSRAVTQLKLKCLPKKAKNIGILSCLRAKGNI